MQIDILLVWIPGHHQIEFNETADLLAKETAHDIYTGSLSAPSVVSYSDAVKISASIASKSWPVTSTQEVFHLLVLLVTVMQ